jgi:nitroimidazol reductase NimA-like FMN-containing flavoprotein (pyridoxamine 5'-phosphate oxidase superfamily)
MPRQMTAQEREAFLAGKHVGVVSVARDDGRPPHTVPVWYGYEPGGNLTFFTGTMGRRAQKITFIEKAGTLSLLVQREDVPGREHGEGDGRSPNGGAFFEGASPVLTTMKGPFVHPDYPEGIRSV